MRVAVILLACVTALASAQYNQDVDNLSPKGLPVTLRSARFQRLPSARPVLPTQAGLALANQRIRRPITFKPKGAEDPIATKPGSFTPIKPLRPPITLKPKGAEDSLATGPGSFTPIKPLRPPITSPFKPKGGEDSTGPGSFTPPIKSLRPLPNSPSAPAPASPQVKPVSEEPEDDIRNRDSQDDENSDLSEEPLDSQEESEENVPRNIGNLGSISRSSNVPAAQPVQYRPFPSAGGPTGRGSIAPATPAPAPVQYRPAPKPNKPRKPVEESYKQQVKPPTKPVKSEAYDARGKKPVAQIIRRYRNDNSDGSITWGFENDDGSYKEEIIGVDCITRGKYGYIDPDGNRREYSYETGIKCDEQQEEEENGFVDYHENKLVLPDGKTIDLSTMGKKQSRRPR